MLDSFYLSITLLTSFGIMIAIAYMLWKRRKFPLAFKMFFIVISTAIYTLGYAHEIVFREIEPIKISIMAEYVGIPFIPVFWFLFVADLTGILRKIKKRIWLLFIIPITTLILEHTNEVHHLFYKDLYMVNTSYFPMVHLVKGPWYWVHIMYSYLLLIICFILFLHKFQKESKKGKKRTLVMILSFCFPWIFNIIYIINNQYLILDLTPFGFVISEVLFSLVIYRYNLLQFTPIASKQIFESMEDGVIVFNLSNQIINYNKSVCNIITELKKVHDIDSNTNRIFANYPELNNALKLNHNQEEKLIIKKQNQIFYYKMNLSFIEDNKNILGKVIVLTDITDNIVNMNRITDMATQMAAINTLKDRMISIVANDLYEPMEKIVSLTHILETNICEMCNNKQFVEEIRQYSNDIYVKVNHLLECFRDKETNIINSPMNWQLSKLVKEALDTIRTRARAKNINITLDVSEAIYVFTDKNIIIMILINLLTNAIKFTHKYGKIIISEIKDNDFVIISIKDTGIGINPERIQVLFQDVQCSPGIGTEGEVGIGMGLFLCRQMIQRISGDIWVDSTEGEGSNFFISVPVNKKDETI